jgi:hypothetical protein
VLRDAREETGLGNLRIAKDAGKDTCASQGEQVVHYFFLLEVAGEVPETWLSYEMNPSDGSPAPIDSNSSG